MPEESEKKGHRVEGIDIVLKQGKYPRSHRECALSKLTSVMNVTFLIRLLVPHSG